MVAQTISRIGVAGPEEIRTTPSNDAPVPSSRRPDIVAAIGIQVAQALITAFHASNTTEAASAHPTLPLDPHEPKGASLFTDEPTLVSLYRSWYGANHVVRLSFVRPKK